MRTFANSSSNRSARLAPTLLLASALAACESDVAAPPEPTFDEGEITLDASAHAAYAYLSLADGGSVVAPADPSSSKDWHLAFRRFSVRLNGGVGGPGSVAGHNLGNNSSLSAEQVVALTAEQGKAAFDGVAASDIPGADSFEEDGLVPDSSASWFRFDRQAGTIVANPGAAWKLRESSGRGHGVFRLVAVESEGQRPVGVSIQFRRQDPGGALGAPDTINASLRRGPAFAGLAGGLADNPGGCDWDITVTPDLQIDVNSRCEAGTFPLDVGEDFAALARADDAPEYGAFLATIGGAFPGTIGSAEGVFWYNIEKKRRLRPTYNVFLVRAEDAVYKVQVFDYYSSSGDSGHPSVRYQRLR